MDQSKTQKQQEFDRLRNIKFKGYCLAHTPPGDETTLGDLVTFAKFFLCKHAKKLWKDPIWEEYTDEEILIEYFAHLYSKDEKLKTEFEAAISAGEVINEEIYEWFDKKIAENQVEMQQKLESLPEKISFSPEKNEDKEE